MSIVGRLKVNVWDLVFSTMPFILSVIFGDQPKEKNFQIEIVQFRQLRKTVASPENTHTHTHTHKE